MDKIITINGSKYQLMKEFQKTTIPSDWDIQQYDHWYDEQHCLASVKENGPTLRFVKDQTEEICLEAVKEDGYALKFVKVQTKEICLEAVKQDKYALRYVDKRVFEVDDQ